MEWSHDCTPLDLQEFVDLYTSWLLSGSIQKKFKAFKQGFDVVMSQSCLADLVIAEELEVIICGSTVSDPSAAVFRGKYVVTYIPCAGVGH